jgi:hypothetical protein
MRFIYRCACVFLGVVLGAAGCASAPEYGPLPSRLYVLDGQVVAAVSGSPIAGIAVDLQGYRVLTQGDGTWQMEADIVPSGDADHLEVRDVDGVQNGGLFQAEIVPLDPTSTGGRRWEQHDIRVDLDPAG